VTSRAILREVIAYFDSKTQSILQRYGPGPRVHYHTGLVDDPPPPDASIPILREHLIAGQERMLRDAADVWNATSHLSGQVLDVGCGLGGGAIFWAKEFGAQVTAVTCVPSHAGWVSRFAAEAGVGPQIDPLVCDAAEVPGENLYDAAVAVDSSGYLPRKDWFSRVTSLLRPGGSVFIIDCFLERPQYADLFNRHWRTRIGTIEEYGREARAAGLRAGSVFDVTGRTKHFWTTTLALIEAEANRDSSNDGETVRQTQSYRAHSLVKNGLVDGGLRYALLSFSKDR
jgi:tocopherol O-methyltransferase